MIKLSKNVMQSKMLVATMFQLMNASKNSLKIPPRKWWNHLIQETLFTAREPMQPNSYTILKTTSVAVTSVSVLSIQQSSTSKNTQSVTPPKYPTPKSMTNLGTVLLNAKCFHHVSSIALYCLKDQNSSSK